MTVKPSNNILNRLAKSLQAFTALSLIWLVLTLVLSVIEFFYNKTTHGVAAQTATALGWVLLYDGSWWMQVYIIIVLPFIIVCLFSERLASVICIIIFVILILAQILLAKYFSTALVPLGADLYGYSWQDIKQTVGASGGVSWVFTIGVIVFFIAVIFIFYKIAPRIKIPMIVSLVLIIIIAVLDFLPAATISSTPQLKSDFVNNLVLNKPAFFFNQSAKHFFPADSETDIYSDEYMARGDENSMHAFNYVNEASYPFLHADSTPDVLSPFFTTSSRPPNIVIIIVEGLGRAFCNKGAYLGNFTPFVDSLASQSLYYENFLSEGGRTFAVLPSILGSLPFGKNGFLELGNAMPNHLSLINLLKHNGYHSSFYYGGDAHFDNMQLFLQHNNIDEINDEATYPAGYTKLPSSNGFTWGYNDKQLFRRFADTRPVTTTAPQLSIVLTVSTHSPFQINEEEKYTQQFEERMDKLGFDETAKKDHRLYSNQYASVLYTDDALRQFFNNYSKRADYANTIFLVTGDHRMPEIPMRNKIDRYHVPLLIFSPLLKRRASFSSVSTHFDIAPSLLAFLGKSYHLQLPANAAWMGAGLDTTRQFGNSHAYPLIQTKTDQVDFIMEGYHLNGSTLFKLQPDMNEEPADEPSKLQSLQNAFAAYRHRDDSWLKGPAALWPDSLYNHFSKH